MLDSQKQKGKRLLEEDTQIGDRLKKDAAKKSTPRKRKKTENTFSFWAPSHVSNPTPDSIFSFFTIKNLILHLSRSNLSVSQKYYFTKQLKDKLNEALAQQNKEEKEGQSSNNEKKIEENTYWILLAQCLVAKDTCKLDIEALRDAVESLKETGALPQESHNFWQRQIEALRKVRAFDSYDEHEELLMSGFNWVNVNLSSANLSEVIGDSAILCNANLSHVDFEKAQLIDANFVNTNLYCASLANGCFDGSNFSGGYFVESTLDGASFTEAQLTNADLTHVMAQQTNFGKANLTNSNLTGALLTQSEFQNAILVNTNLKKTDLSEAELMNADLRGANLTSADMRWANLNNANLTGAKLTGVEFFDPDATEDVEPQAFKNTIFFESTMELTEESISQVVESLSSLIATNWNCDATTDKTFIKRLYQAIIISLTKVTNEVLVLASTSEKIDDWISFIDKFKEKLIEQLKAIQVSPEEITNIFLDSLNTLAIHLQNKEVTPIKGEGEKEEYLNSAQPNTQEDKSSKGNAPSSSCTPLRCSR